MQCFDCLLSGKGDKYANNYDNDLRRELAPAVNRLNFVYVHRVLILGLVRRGLIGGGHRIVHRFSRSLVWEPPVGDGTA